MCTTTWVLHDGGYDLLFNRDESVARATGEPPRVVRVGAARAIAPRDPDFGGSWIGVNEHGVSLCILNRYEDDAMHEEGRAFESRGLLLVSLLDLAAVADLKGRLEAADPARYRPFSLLALGPGRPPLLASWSGRALSAAELGERDMPVVSSGWRFRAVEAARRAAFEDLRRTAPGGIDADALLGFHRSHAPERGPRSPCMHREDASTVSLSRVRVGRREVSLAYAAGPPCTATLGEPLRLPRT